MYGRGGYYPIEDYDDAFPAPFKRQVLYLSKHQRRELDRGLYIAGASISAFAFSSSSSVKRKRKFRKLWRKAGRDIFTLLRHVRRITRRRIEEQTR